MRGLRSLVSRLGWISLCGSLACGAAPRRRVDGKALPVKKGHGLVFSPDGKHLAVAQEDSLVLYSVGNRRVIAKSADLEVHPGHPDWNESMIGAGKKSTYCSDVAFSPDGRTLFWVGSTMDGRHQPCAWRLGEAVKAAYPKWHLDRKDKHGRDTIHCLGLSPDGALIATGGDPVKFWACRSVGAMRAKDYAYGFMAKHQRDIHQPLPERIVQHVAFSPKGDAFAQAQGDQVSLQMVRGDRIYGLDLGRAGVGGIMRALAFAPDGKLLAAGGDPPRSARGRGGMGGRKPPQGKAAPKQPKGAVWLWAIPPQALRKYPAARASFSEAMARSADYNLRVVENLKVKLGGLRTTSVTYAKLPETAGPGIVSVFERTAKLERKISMPGAYQKNWRKQNRKVVCTVAYNLPAERPMAKLEFSSSVMALAFSPKQEALAVGTADGLVHLLKVSSGQTAMILAGHKEAITALAFSPDGKTLATASENDAVKLWSFGK